MLNRLLNSIGYAQGMHASRCELLGCLAIACVLIKLHLPPDKQRPTRMQTSPPDMKAIITHKAYLLTTAAGISS
jgi:hypothetical protein